MLYSQVPGSKLGQTFFKKGYLRIKHHVPSREKHTVQTKRNQLICTEQGGEKATQPAYIMLPLPACALERCSTATLQPRQPGTSLFSKFPGLAQTCQWWLVAWGEQNLFVPGELPAATPKATPRRTVTAAEAAGGQVWVKACQGRGLNA